MTSSSAVRRSRRRDRDSARTRCLGMAAIDDASIPASSGMIASRCYGSGCRSALEPAVEQAGDGRLGCAELAGDLGQRPPLQVMQLDRAALAFGQRRERFGHLEQLFLTDRLPAGRRLLGGQPLFDARGRLVERLIRETTRGENRACGPSACARRPPGCGSGSTAASRRLPGRCASGRGCSSNP